ncbi:cytochrome c3 family protein [Eggerthella sinensis]|uniref:cytochrome c3 family protein n=1 Tax=Eggerthella sinensis TaxID=242230 RepID=UPI0022E24E1B|nr:cytochrome c3 family protein [Eggerthella sinensis]
MTTKNRGDRLAAALAAAALACTVIAGISGCAPQASSPGENEAGGESEGSETFSWSIDSNCAQCHDVEAGSLDDASCLAATHGNEGLECVDCHTGESELSAAHEGATASETMPKKLKKTRVEDNACTPCHGSYEEIAAATPDALVTDSRGTALNPHEAPGLTEGHEGNLACASCHTMHRASNAASDAHDACMNCHHEDVFECGTCHS